MAATWQGTAPESLGEQYVREATEGSAQYRVRRSGNRLSYEVRLSPTEPAFKGEVETVVGGRRHGLSFLLCVAEIGGMKIDRPALVEARYLQYSPSDHLVLSPGFPAGPPQSWETGLGRVLSPAFEKKCLNCHGAATEGRTETGVRCEACHGPGSEHVKAVGAGLAAKAILNPKKLSNDKQLELCAQCHAGFGVLHDPLPDDLLISNQVNALRNSQCYIQSGAGLSCTTCHDPHHDASKDDTRPVEACLGCHNAKVQDHAGLCPISKTDGCVRCHMPEQQKGSFHMVDHWIRVHPETGAKAAAADPANRTHVVPKRLYLRWVAADNAAKAEAARRELDAGAAFYGVAQKYSTAEWRMTGGYLGDVAASDLDPVVARAALALDRGAHSPVIDVNRKKVIVYRMPRDFRADAEKLEREATSLRERGSLNEAVAKYQASLQVYPRFLRSLVFLGVAFGQQGDPGRAAAVLEYAARFYPEDPAVQYNLGISYGALGRAPLEIKAYRRAIELQEDLIPAHLNLGAALFAAGRLDEAVAAYRNGLQQNPLSANLYFNLSQVLEQQGKADEAKRALALAKRIDAKAGENAR
jgi:tetratricopeptide (TPR) repeat protein